MPRIPPIVQGETRTLLEAATANEVIDYLNSLLDLKVSPAGWGRLVASPRNTVLDLTGIQKALQIQVQAAVSHPLKVGLSGDKASVVYGTIGGLVPTIGGSPLSSDPAPLLSVGSTSASGSVYAACEIVSDTASAAYLTLLSVQIRFASTIPANTAYLAHIELARINRGTLLQSVTGSLSFHIGWGEFVFSAL